MITKHPTNCCALCGISASDNDSKEDILSFIQNLKKESFNKKYNPQLPDGQRAVFCITTPSEKNLRKNLRELGFTISRVFNRRNGYEPGVLTLWMINW